MVIDSGTNVTHGKQIGHKGSILVSTINHTLLLSQQSTNIILWAGICGHFCALDEQFDFVIWLVSSTHTVFFDPECASQLLIEAAPFNHLSCTSYIQKQDLNKIKEYGSMQRFSLVIYFGMLYQLYFWYITLFLNLFLICLRDATIII